MGCRVPQVVIVPHDNASLATGCYHLRRILKGQSERLLAEHMLGRRRCR